MALKFFSLALSFALILSVNILFYLPSNQESHSSPKFTNDVTAINPIEVSSTSLDSLAGSLQSDRNWKQCPTQPIISVVNGGRLANKIWEYAAVWSLARLTGRPGYVPNTILTPLKEVFANLSLRSLDEIEHCQLDLGAQVKKHRLLPLESIEKNFEGQNILLEKWLLLPHPVLKYLKEAKEEFRFRPEILREVEETVKKVGGEGRTRVGIHVRRTDYFRYLQFGFNTTLAGGKYYKTAIQSARKHIGGPLIFLIVSDDLVWCRKNLLDAKVKDVVIASKSPAHDLALLATSAHNIIDYGTFGEWGAVMAGGHTMALDVDKYFTAAMKNFTSKWHVYKMKYYEVIKRNKPKKQSPK